MRSLQLLLLLLLKMTDAFSISADYQRDGRIVGGDLAKISQVPYLVNIRQQGFFLCGGSLVTSRCVLTAAHCIANGAAHDYVVRGGVTLLSDIEQTSTVERIFIPTKYNNHTFEHDFGILRLNAKFKGKNVKSISIADFTPASGDHVQVSGWGLTHENAVNPSEQVRTASLRVLSQEHCRALYDDYRNVTETMFCAAVPGQKDACLADSGGPAVAQGRLVGVVSWGKKQECGRSDSPGVYVRLNKVRKWIMNILYKHC